MKKYWRKKILLTVKIVISIFMHPILKKLINRNSTFYSFDGLLQLFFADVPELYFLSKIWSKSKVITPLSKSLYS